MSATAKPRAIVPRLWWFVLPSFDRDKFDYGIGFRHYNATAQFSCNEGTFG